MKIVIGSDHAGYMLKERLIQFLRTGEHQIQDMGTHSEESVDYPDIAESTCEEYKRGGYDFGIVLCGTGIGISIAANKVKGIRCAPVCDVYGAEMARAHNSANFIAFGGRMTYAVPVEVMLEAFMNAQFQEGRHSVRVAKVADIESRNGKTAEPS